MAREIRVYLFVFATTAAAIFAAVCAWPYRMPFPGWWPLATFVFVAALLESLNTRLRISARGSTSFIMHMAAALLFGGFWAAAVAGVSTLVGEFVRNNTPLKTLFNVAQRVLSVCAAVAVYNIFGGSLPPAYLVSSPVLSSQPVQQDLGLFFVFAAVYFLINAASVNTAIVLSSGRAFREVWNLNTRGLLGYDLGASAIAVLVAWLYVTFDAWLVF